MSTPENYEDKPAEAEDTIPSLIPLDQTSYESSSYGSINDRDPKFVFVDSNREVLMEIGYLEDKVRLIEALRLIDWDPTFWSLNDEIVDWFNSDETTIRKKIQELQNSIHEKEKILVTTRMNMRQKNKERGVYDPALDLFPDLVEPPNNNEPSNDLSALAATICQQVRDVEAAKIKNLEHEYKLASMDVKLSRLREDLKSFEEKSKHVDVNKHLLAVETQNSMLNEFLNSIIEGIKETTKDIERLDSKDPNVLIRIIKDASDLNYRVISECYPHIESKPGVSQLLWLPHDIKFMGMEEYLTTMRPKEHYLDVKIDWKQRKKDVKEIGETRDQLLLLKRKLKWQEHRIATGRQGTIQYLTEQQASMLSPSFSGKLPFT